MSAATNPYVGPRPFERGQVLYGRDREIADLLKTVVTERVVLLHSPSGAGKTSLVQAGLVATLEAEDFTVLPVARVGMAPTGDGNRYVKSVVASLEEARPEGARLPSEELGGWDLAGYLGERTLTGQDGDVVLILDQFEEVLTLDPTDRGEKEAFFRQIGRALAGIRRLWAVLVIREEFVSGLEPYTRFLPGGLGARYRLERLDRTAALDAVKRTAAQQGGRFEDAAAERLVDNLRLLTVQEEDGSVREVLGPWVEPVQLQVVCRSLWARLSGESRVIREEDVRSVGDVDTCLAQFYAEQVAAAASKAGTNEHELRRWIDDRLITAQGLRSQVVSGHGETLGVPNTALTLLVDAHILRREQRRGVTWWELAHDRMVRPVKEDNALWYRERLHPLQRQAALWRQEGRPPRLLLQGDLLDKSILWADSHPDEVSDADLELLSESRKQQAEVDREFELTRALADERSRSLRRVRIMLGVVLALLLVSAWLAQKAFIERDSAKEQRRIADAAATVAVEKQAEAERAARNNEKLREEAVGRERRAQRDRVRASDAVAALVGLLLRNNQEDDALLAVTGTVTDSLRETGWTQPVDSSLHVALVDAVTAAERSFPFQLHSAPLTSVRFVAGGQRLVTVGRDSEVRLWSLPNLKREASARLPVHLAVDVVPDEAHGRLIVPDSRRHVHALDGTTLRELAKLDYAASDDGPRPRYAAVLDDGRVFVTGEGARAMLWSPDDDTSCEWPRVGAAVTGRDAAVDDASAIAGPVDGIVAVGFRSGTVQIFRVPPGTDLCARSESRPETLPPARERSSGHVASLELASGPDGLSVLAATWRGATTLYRRPEGGEWSQTPLQWSAVSMPLRAAFLQPPSLAVTIDTGGAVAILDAADPDRMVAVVSIGSDQPAVLAVSPVARRLAVGTPEGRVVVLQTDLQAEPRERLKKLVSEDRAHSADVTAADFSPDGGALATAGRDGRVRVWNLGSVPDLSAATDAELACRACVRLVDNMASAPEDTRKQIERGCRKCWSEL